MGEWNFTLTAQLDGVEFSGSTRAKAVAGKTVSLTFDLTTSESKGGFTLQVFFSGEANEALARIQSVSDGRYYNPQGHEITTTHDSTLIIEEDDQGKKYVLLSAPIKLSGTECGFLDGSYKIQIDFNYKDGDTRCLLNTYETSVQIKAGYICKAVATLDLVGKYSVTLHFNGGSLNDSSPENDVLTSIYQRKKAVSLPGSEQMRKSGHTFAGWYDNEDLNGSAVTELAAGSQGSFDYWAKWEEESSTGSVTLYVKDGGSGDGSSEDSAFGTLADAASYIESNGNSATDYDIKIVGELEGPQAFIINNASKAKSITIEGATGLDANGAPQCSIDGDWESEIDGVLLISVNNDELMGSFTVTVKNLKIYMGTAPKPGLVAGHNNGLGYTSTNVILEGVHITENSDGGIKVLNKSSVTLSDGCKVYSNTATGKGSGVYVYNGAKFTMSGSAMVASDNDVYLDENCVVTIGGTLTGTSPVATITPKIDATTSSYPTTPVIAVASDSGTTLVAEHSKFAVTPIDAGGGVTLNFELDADGKIVAESSGGGTVTYYISPTGNDGNDGLSESNAIATVQHLVEDLMTDEDTDYIINVCGDMTSGSESEWLMKNITDAKSITIQGNEDTNEGNILPGVWIQSKGPVTFKNIQLGALFADAVQYDEDGYYHANIILDSGTLINNSSIASIDGHGMNGIVEIYQKGAVTLTMKSGAAITSNTINDGLDPASGFCGGVYIGQYSEFRMEGGTISGNALFDVSNCYDGYFYMSGDAQAGKVYCKSYYEPTSQSVPVYISGPLTGSTPVATITPGFYADWQALEIEKDYNDNPVTTTTIGDVYNKFAVTPHESTNYEIDSNGKLQESSGGGIPQGFALVEGDTFSSDLDSHVGTKENVYDSTAGTITIPDLQVCSHLVTQAEYEKYMAYYGKVKEIDSVTPASTGSESTPATYVTWMEAIIYCNLRSVAEGLTPVYSLNDDTSVNTWTKVLGADGKYYIDAYIEPDTYPDSDILDSVSGYDLDSSAFNYDLTANGYRLPTSAEYSYILTKNETLITGSYNEWCQNYYYDYRRIWFKASEQKPTSEEKYALSREANLGFRVVRNKQ